MKASIGRPFSRMWNLVSLLMPPNSVVAVLTSWTLSSAYRLTKQCLQDPQEVTDTGFQLQQHLMLTY